MNIRNLVKTAFDGILNLFFPDYCVICGRPLADDEKYICNSCANDLPLTYIMNFENNFVVKKLWGRAPVVYGFSYMYFLKGSVTQKLLHEIKYKGGESLGRFMGEKMGVRMQELGFPSDFDVILPVPLHPARLQLRGYNQSEMIARGIAEIYHKPVDVKSVERTVFNVSQTHLSKQERWENVRNIFSLVKPARLRNKHVLLVDDVLTTGSTMESLAGVVAKVTDKISFVTLATASQEII